MVLMWLMSQVFFFSNAHENKYLTIKRKKHSSTDWVIVLHLHSHLMGQELQPVSLILGKRGLGPRQWRRLARGHTTSDGRTGIETRAFLMVHGLGRAQMGMLGTG